MVRTRNSFKYLQNREISWQNRKSGGWGRSSFLGRLEEMERICQLTNLIANSQLLKSFIEPNISTNILIWMIVSPFSWNLQRTPSDRSFQCHNYFHMNKKLTHQRNRYFFYSKRSWIDHYNWKKYLIDNPEAYSEPSLTFTMELFQIYLAAKACMRGYPNHLF